MTWLYKHTYNIIFVVIAISILSCVIYYSIWADEQKQLAIDNRSDMIMSMTCAELKQYTDEAFLYDVDHGKDSRESFARAKYYYDNCQIDNGWLADSGGYCDGIYFRFGPGFHGDDWTCSQDWYPRDKTNKIIYFPPDWYYITETGDRVDDPTYVLTLHKAHGTIYNLGEYKGIIDPDLKLDVREHMDLYYGEIESILRHGGAR